MCMNMNIENEDEKNENKNTSTFHSVIESLIVNQFSLKLLIVLYILVQMQRSEWQKNAYALRLAYKSDLSASSSATMTELQIRRSI